MRTKLFFRLFFILLFLFFIIVPLMILILGIQSKPSVMPGKKLTFQDVERVKQLLSENDPRRLKAGEIKSVSVTERDLNLFLDYTFSHAPQPHQVYAHIDLSKNAAHGRFSLMLPKNPFGNYLNIASIVYPTSRNIAIGKLKIGALTFPGWLLNPVARLGHRFLQRYEQYQDFIEVVQSIQDITIAENSMQLTYQWKPDAIKQLSSRGRSFLLTEDEKKRLRAYHECLVVISHQVTSGDASLTEFIVPMFQFARKRSDSGQNPSDENRALLLTLSAYSVGRNLTRVLGEQQKNMSQQPRSVSLTLLGRNDLAKHFLVSAALTVSGGSGFANLLGIFKEMDDAQGGSGFSFADLAADQAGVKLAGIAMSSSQQARLLQQRMSGVTKETEYMPRVDHLPEGIMELEFKRIYRDLDSKTYQMAEKEIERRIAACRVYQ